MKKFISCVIIFVLIFGLFADVLELKSGALLNGNIKGYDKDVIYLKLEDGQKILVSKDLVKTVNSPNYDGGLLSTNKSSYPRDYSDYQIPEDKSIFATPAPPDSNLVGGAVANNSSKSAYLPYSESYAKGIKDAKSFHSSGGYIIGGMASGFLLGLIGTGIITLAAGGSDPSAIPPNCEPNAYLKGYHKQSKSSNKGAALTGGLIGTAAIVLLIAANSSKQTDD